jgi:hypothetical protein
MPSSSYCTPHSVFDSCFGSAWDCDSLIPSNFDPDFDFDSYSGCHGRHSSSDDFYSYFC